jgi:hypothetical protein
MIKKTPSITLAMLFVLPAICLAGGVEVGGIRMKLKGDDPHIRHLLIQIPIVNNTPRGLNMLGKLAFYDADGFELDFWPVAVWLDPYETKIIHTSGLIFKRAHTEATTFKLLLEVPGPMWRTKGKPRPKIERDLTLPEWD